MKQYVERSRQLFMNIFSNTVLINALYMHAMYAVLLCILFSS